MSHYDPAALKVMLAFLLMTLVMLFLFLWIATNFVKAFFASISVTTLATGIALAIASIL